MICSIKFLETTSLSITCLLKCGIMIHLSIKWAEIQIFRIYAKEFIVSL